MKYSCIAAAILTLLAAEPAIAFPDCPTQYWSPSSVGHKEQLPNTHRPNENNCKITEFRVDDHQWMNSVRLPSEFSLLRIINSSLDSGKTLKIYGAVQGVAGDPLKLAAGRSIDFRGRSKGHAAWLQHPELHTAPNQPQWQIPRNSGLISNVTLRDGKHAGQLILPATGSAFDTITIHNASSTETNVLGTHTAFPGQRMTVLPNSTARAEFDPVAKQWDWVHAPYSVRTLAQRYQRISSRSILELYDGEWIGRVPLPLTRYDRDRHIILSDADWDSLIDPNRDATYALRKGDEYEFIYISEWGRWHVLRQPVQQEILRELKNGRLTDEGYLLTKVSADEGTAANSQLRLPAPRQGARIVLTNTSSHTIPVTYGTFRANARPREQIVFRSENGSTWQRETVTIDLAFLIDLSAEEVENSWDAHMIMRENLRLANEALENSGATYRYREAAVRVSQPGEFGYFPRKELWRVPTLLFDDRHALQFMKDHDADGIYYGGSHRWSKNDCDWYRYSSAAKSLVIATSLTCPTTTFRQGAGYAHGLPVVLNPRQPIPVIGAGNQLPFYPTPHKLLPDNRIAVNPGQEHILQKMNAMGEQFSKYSEQRR